jgi:Beta-lactamase superfamily domain
LGDQVKVTVIGHLSMLFEEGGTSLLLDPLLVPTFGHEYSPKPVELYPPRRVDAGALQEVSAVLISHEHFDHFNLESLRLLPRTIPVVVGPTMLAGVVRAIEALGFSVLRLNFHELYDLGGLQFTLYPAAPETAHWEKRVSQLLIADQAGGSMLVQVDALFGSQAIADATAELPTALAIANNANIPPRGVQGALTNYAARFEPRPVADGVRLVKGLLAAVEDTPELASRPIIFTGGGFRKDYDELGVFALAEQDAVGRLARELTGRDDIFGALPGESFILSRDGVSPAGRVGWVTVDEARFAELRNQRESFIARRGTITRSHVMPTSAADADRLPDAEKALCGLASYLLISDLGQHVVELAKRHNDVFLLRIVNEHDDLVYDYRFDVIESAFVAAPELSKVPQDDLADTFDYGIVFSLCDFLALIDGRIQIWDLAGVAIDAWFASSHLSGPMPLMYVWWGEQVIPELYERLLEKQLHTLLPGQGHEGLVTA